MRLSIVSNVHATESQPAEQPGVAAREDKQTMEACRQFEQLVVSNLLHEMRDSIPGDSLIPKGNGEKVFQDMLDNEYAGEISRTSPFGLASMLYHQFRPESPATPKLDDVS